MSSWVYGDPAPPILRAYVGDPAKIRLVHGGIKETHVFHLHNHQWRLEPENPVSTIIDSITISPQECYTLDILYGSGSRNGVIGDVIFHCHLYPHFHEGMWTLWRIHDRLEDGSGKLPDGTRIPALQPLKARKCPPAKDELHPGYPNFMQGKVGEPPLQPHAVYWIRMVSLQCALQPWKKPILWTMRLPGRYIRTPAHVIQ